MFGDTANLASPAIYGGEAPTWIEFGGYDIAADEVIEATGKANDGLESVATAAGATVPWITLTDLADGLDTEIVQFIAYDGDGRAMQIDRFAVPAPNATDASTIAAQERRLLQTLLLSRERAAGQGGVRKADYGEGIGEEFESLAVFDRRIAETRARIAWFEQAAEVDRVVRAGGRRERASPRGVLVGRPPQAASARAWHAMPGRRVESRDRKTPLAHPGRSQAVLDVGDSVGRE